MTDTNVQLGPTIQAAEALQPTKIDYDYHAAREAGLTDADIADYLAAETQYDIAAAREAGIKNVDVIKELSTVRDPGAFATLAEGINRGMTETGGMGLGAYGGFKAGVPLAAAASAAFPPAAPVTAPVVLGATTIAGALTGGYLINELNEYFFPEEPLRRGLYEGGRTFGGGILPLPVPYLAASRNAALGPAMHIREFVKKQGGKPIKATPVEQVLETAMTRPMSFAAIETGAAGTSAALGGAAEQNDPGNVLKRTAAEITGAIFNPAQILRITAPVIQPLKTALSTLTTEGRYKRLGTKVVKILEDAGEDPTAVLKALRSDRELATLAADAGVDLDTTTAAGKALSPTLAKLQADIAADLKSGPTLERASLQNLTAMTKMVDLMIAMDDPSLLDAAATMQRNIYEELLQSRLNQVEGKAADTAGNIISTTPTAAKKAGEVIETQTRQVLTEARDQERILYTRVNKTEPAAAGSVVAAFDQIRADLLPESPFPSLITRFVNRVSGRDMETVEDAFVVGYRETQDEISRLRSIADKRKDKFQEFETKYPGAADRVDGALAYGTDMNAVIAEIKSDLGSFDTVIRDLANVAGNYREKGLDVVGSDLSAVERARVASHAERLIDFLQAEQKVIDTQAYQRNYSARLQESQAAEAARAPDAPDVTVGDLTRFRSEMLSMARDARAAGNYRDSNFYGQMAEAALDDLGLASQTIGPKTQNQLNLQAAHNFSRSLNDVFTRAFSGDILGKSRTGAAKLPPELVFDTVMRGSANATNLKLLQIQDAARFMADNAGEDFADSAAARLGTVRGAQETMLRGQASNFYNPATDRVNMNGLTAWMRQNDEALSMFPSLKDDLTNSVTAQKLLADARKEDSLFRKGLDNQLALSAFLGNAETPAAGVGTLIGSPGNRPKNPASNLNAAAKAATQTSPEVAAGLRDAILDHAYVFAGGADDKMSFKAYRDYLFKPLARGQQSVMGIMRQQGLFSDAEATRLNTILREATFIEDAIVNGERGNYKLKDAPSAIYDLVVRIGGLGIGAQISKLTGRTQGLVEASTGIQFARNKFQHMPNTYFNDLLQEAARNPATMELLINKGLNASAGNKSIRLNRQLNSALINAGLTPTEEQIQNAQFNLTLPNLVSPANAAPSTAELEQYLQSINTPPQAAPAPLPNAAPPATPGAQPPVQAPPPAAGGGNPNMRANYATMFPNDPVSGLINAQQQQQQQQGAR